MTLNKYFQDELTALRVLGAEFADSNPRLAPFLATEAQDPDVERLLEGFAFLSGRLKEKLDDELPELTHSIMNLLWPDFLKPLPSLSIIELTPLAGLTRKKQIKRKSMVLSTPVDGTQCQFQTCYEVDLFPLKVSELQHNIQSTGSNIAIKLVLLDEKASFEEMKLDNLRFHLFGNIHTSYQLYLFFSRYLQALKISAIDKDGNKILLDTLDKLSVKAGGFANNENLFPGSENLFHGYRILQEYFALPEKFLFINFSGLTGIAEKIKLLKLDDITGLQFDCQFDSILDNSLSISADSMKLFCTPVVNLFRHQSAPIQLDHRQVEYRILPSASNPAHYEVYQIEEVEGWGYDDFKRKRYPCFESFEHSLQDNEDNLYYRVRVKETPDGQAMDNYISFINHYEGNQVPQEETIEASLICTNKKLSAKLGIGDIQLAGEGMPEFVEIKNISEVTPEFIPPMDKGFHWQLISNMSLNYQSLMNKDALKIIFSSYDYRSYYDKHQARASQHRLDGIKSIKVDLIDRIYKGRPVRGVRSVIRVQESKFTNEGEMYLFFCVLNEFFALYASLNSFHELLVKGIEQGEVYKWPARIGQQPVI